MHFEMFSLPLSLPRSAIATDAIEMPIEFYVKSWREDLLTPIANRGAPSCFPTSQHIKYNQQKLGGTLLVEQLIEALRYKPEGRGIDSRFCHWNFSLT
jgi:hypothetical protein